MKSQKPQLFLAKGSSLLLNSFIFLTLSCAKVTYVTEQGWGQFKIQWNGRGYEEVLEDPKVPADVKGQIKKIQAYKNHFYNYFEKEPTSIYSEVTFLDREAVSHLVIASLYNKIEPHNEWFPFVGEFPYLGFFDEESAKSYAKEKEEDQYYTYIRPVYAYSSLGNFEDKILSSFFQYKDEDLAELIFHELFHTIFFIKDNVDLNENLANYFGKEMMYEYFKIGNKQQEKRLEQAKKFEGLRFSLVNLIDRYKEILKKQEPKNKKEADILLKEFLDTQFIPSMKSACKKMNIKSENCYPIRVSWNNARFAAYMTYEKKVGFIKKLHQEKSLSLKELFNYLDEKYKEYKRIKPSIKFHTWIEKQ